MLNDFILNGVTQMSNMLGKPKFLWKGESFNCIPNTVNDSGKAVVGGFDEDADFRMTVLLNQFAPNVYPEINDVITYNGYQMLIKQIKKPAHNVYWIYQCELPKVNR